MVLVVRREAEGQVVPVVHHLEPFRFLTKVWMIKNRK